jgi:DNA primase
VGNTGFRTMARREEVNGDLPNIADVLRHYGANIRATHGQINLRCPFHSDTHQSGTANLDRNIFICFACGVQGNSLQLISGQEHITINEAKRFAERITGESNGEIQRKYSSGGRLPKKQRYSNRDSTAGAIRRSRRG